MVHSKALPVGDWTEHATTPKQINMTATICSVLYFFEVCWIVTTSPANSWADTALIGDPHLTHAGALSLTSDPHSEHLHIAINKPSKSKLRL